jgi:hypothetical protein
MMPSQSAPPAAPARGGLDRPVHSYLAALIAGHDDGAGERRLAFDAEPRARLADLLGCLLVGMRYGDQVAHACSSLGCELGER